MTSLRRQWDRMRNIPGLGRDLLAMSVLVVLGVGSAGYILSNYSIDWPWTPKTVFTAHFGKGPGLVARGQQDVRIAGVNVGDVTDVEPDRDGITARIAIEPGHPVYSNAHLDLKSKTPLNDPYVSLDPGGPPGTPLPDDGSGDIPLPQTARLVQPFEVLNKLDERSQHALTELLNQADVGLTDAPRTLPGSLNAVTTTLDTARPVVEQLRIRRERIQKLVTALSQISSAVGKNDKRLADLVSSLQQTLATVSGRDSELDQSLSQLPGLTGDLRHAMSSVSSLTTQLDPTLDDLHAASEALPPALSRLGDVVEKAGPVVDAAGPVVAKARPVVGDLRPLVSDADAALRDLNPVTGRLPNASAQIAPWMDNLAAFVYQTSSAFSLHDANGGYGRAQVFIDVSNPLGGLKNQGAGTSPGPGDEARTKKTGDGQ